MANSPYPIDPALTAVVIGYRNMDLIADRVLPRMPVGKQEYKYMTLTKRDMYSIPETAVGRKGVPREVEFGGTETTGTCENHALKDFVPQGDVENADSRYDPLGRAAEGTQALLDLAREKRTADLVFAAANFPTGNKATLSGTSQWSHASSDPVAAILAALDGPLIRPNVMVLGQEVWTKLRQHAKIVAAVAPMGGNAASGGVALRQAVAELFELDEIIVGKGFLNTAKKGQTDAFSRVWGKHAALLHRNMSPDAGRITTFGFTASWMGPTAYRWFDPNPGVAGGTNVKVGDSTDEVICASDLGYLFTDAVA